MCREMKKRNEAQNNKLIGSVRSKTDLCGPERGELGEGARLVFTGSRMNVDAGRGGTEERGGGG